MFINIELKVDDGLSLDVDQCVDVRRLLCNNFDGLFRCPFSFGYVVASYGCCSCCSYSTRVEKEEEITGTQEHKKTTSKRNPRNPRNSKPGRRETRKNLSFSTLNNREQFLKIKLNRKEAKKT
jgi:hypothetical protein